MKIPSSNFVFYVILLTPLHSKERLWSSKFSSPPFLPRSLSPATRGSGDVSRPADDTCPRCVMERLLFGSAINDRSRVSSVSQSYCHTAILSYCHTVARAGSRGEMRLYSRAGPRPLARYGHVYLARGSNCRGLLEYTLTRGQCGISSGRHASAT